MSHYFISMFKTIFYKMIPCVVIGVYNEGVCGCVVDKVAAMKGGYWLWNT